MGLHWGSAGTCLQSMVPSSSGLFLWKSKASTTLPGLGVIQRTLATELTAIRGGEWQLRWRTRPSTIFPGCFGCTEFVLHSLPLSSMGTGTKGPELKEALVPSPSWGKPKASFCSLFQELSSRVRPWPSSCAPSGPVVVWLDGVQNTWDKLLP